MEKKKKKETRVKLYGALYIDTLGKKKDFLRKRTRV